MRDPSFHSICYDLVLVRDRSCNVASVTCLCVCATCSDVPVDMSMVASDPQERCGKCFGSTLLAFSVDY